MMKSFVKACTILIALISVTGSSSAQKSTRPKKQIATAEKMMASVDGVAITESQARKESAEDLDSLELQNLRSKAQATRNEYEILMKATERIIEEKFLKAEASKLGISVEELLSREVSNKIEKPTSEEIDAFYEAYKERLSGPKETYIEKIADHLGKQKEKILRDALIKKLEKEHKVARNLGPFRTNVKPEGRPSAGPSSAPVVLILFSDFECPHCKTYSEVMKEILKKYENKVQLVFRQYPLTNIHKNAQKAAEAAFCASAQGRFWEMHDLMFQDQNSLGIEELKNKAKKLGLDATVFNDCLTSSRYAGKVREDIHAGAAAGVDGTPALFINGIFLYGDYPAEEIAAVIDEELGTKK
jgi:predicted DsbA family dithiol-disulfide isomerase